MSLADDVHESASHWMRLADRHEEKAEKAAPKQAVEHRAVAETLRWTAASLLELHFQHESGEERA